MAFYLLLLFLSFLFYSTIKPSSSQQSDITCGTDLGSPIIRFPFGLTNQTTTYPGFTLNCNNQSQTILTLPRAGEFVVEEINYDAQTIFIKDPKECFPRRFLNNFSLSNSPFTPQVHQNFTFLNCTSNFSAFLPGLRFVPCLSDHNHTVVALRSDRSFEFAPIVSSCNGWSLGTVVVPVSWPPWSDADTSLSWDVPDCGTCESEGGTCGYMSGSSGLDVGCSNWPHKGLGLSRSTKYGVVFGIGIPGSLCIIGVACWLVGKLSRQSDRRRNANFWATSIMTPQQSIIVSGLDKPTIESYPKITLGESKRLPKPNDTTCPICLSEYEPNETLRTIPECNHYFHAECIDEWLKMNATCPLCRNLPESSSRGTPVSSFSLSPTPSSLLGR